MRELLTDLLEYMESRADADNEGPNKEMGFQIRIEEALAELSTEGLKLSDDLVVKSLAAIHKSEQDLPAPNTVMWWLCRIADPEIRRKAVGYCFKYHITILSQVFDINTAVQCGFGWINTQEGNGYWYNLSKSEIPLLPEPDFTEYNELRK